MVKLHLAQLKELLILLKAMFSNYLAGRFANGSFIISNNCKLLCLKKHFMTYLFLKIHSMEQNFESLIVAV